MASVSYITRISSADVPAPTLIRRSEQVTSLTFAVPNWHQPR